MKNLKEFNLSCYSLTTCGMVYSHKSNRFLRGWYGASGYHLTGLTDDSGIVKVQYTHILVAQVYIPNPEGKKYVNHIDGNKSNPSSSNLEWVTASENLIHAYNHGLTKGKNFKIGVLDSEILNDVDPYSSENSPAKTEEELRNVCYLISQGYRDTDISRMTGKNRRWINDVRHKEVGKNFLCVINEYDFNFVKESRASPETVLKICKMLEDGFPVMEISRYFNVDRKLVGNIKNRKTFKDISSSFSW